MQKALSHIWPLFTIDQDCIISKNADITLVYKLELPALFSLSDKEYQNFHHSWIKAIKSLPFGTVFHKQDWFTKQLFKADFNPKHTSFLEHSSDLHFYERPFLQHHCYVMLTKKSPKTKWSNSNFSNLIRPNLVPKVILDPSWFTVFKQHCEQFKRILEDGGFVKITQVSEKDLLSTPRETGLLERYCFLNAVGSKPLLRDLELGKTPLKIGDQLGCLFSISQADELPSLCGPRITYEPYSTDTSKFSIGFTAPLGTLLSCNHIYNQYVFLSQPSTHIKALERKRLRLQSLAAHSRENHITKQAVNDFLNQAVSGQQLPVKAHFNILAWTDNANAYQELKSKVNAAITKIDATAKIETVGAAQLFWAGIPGNEANFPYNESFLSFLEPCCCFLNLETVQRSSNSPVGIRLGERHYGTPIHVDISDEPLSKGISANRNKFILGPSGSGKSFFTNHMLHAYHQQGAHVVLIDVGHSYQGLCKLLDGYYFTYDSANPFCFNPFYTENAAKVESEQKESIKTLLIALWKKDDQSYSRSDYVTLSNAVNGYFKHLVHKDQFSCFDCFYEYLNTTFKAQLEADGIREKEFDLNNFLYVLRPYYKAGEFDYLLNARTNLDLLQQPFIVFELDAIKDHPVLFPVVTLIIMDVFISKMRKLKGIRKIILIEEAWKAIARAGMAQYIKYLFKTVRKHFGEAIIVTQEIEDIISSKIVKQAIINNSDCKILLDQSKYENKFELVQQLLGLNDKERSMVLSLNKNNDPKGNYKEVFISLAGRYSRVYRTEVSKQEYLTYTTEESEKVHLEGFLEKSNGDFQQAISQMAQSQGTTS